METNRNINQKIISWGFLVYFLILFAERLQSIVRTLIFDKNLFATAFSGYVNCLVIASLLGTLLMLVFWNGDFWKSLFHPDAAPNYTFLCLTSGVLLLSGMVHTEYTVSIAQFIAYGALIVSMIAFTFEAVKAKKKKWPFWYGLLYLTSFSMAIPVMYRSDIPSSVLFHITEAVGSAVLVCFFTYLLKRLFSDDGGWNLFMFVPFVFMILFDAALILMRWEESINWFVLIFAILTAVLFVIGQILKLLSKDKESSTTR